MNKGIGKCFAGGFGRQGRGVDSCHLSGNDLAGDRQPVDEKALGTSHQVKGVACVLPVVEEFVPRGALEAGEAQLELGVFGQRNIIPTE